jgi:hypothetical protein
VIGPQGVSGVGFLRAVREDFTRRSEGGEGAKKNSLFFFVCGAGSPVLK